MANDVNANIRINIDSAEALSQLRALQTQISTFNKSVVQTNAAAVAKQRDLLTTLQAQIGATKQFSTSIVGVESSVSRLGRAIDKNKLSLGEYFRFGIASSKRFGRVFGREHALMTQLATERVKKLQTQYIALGQSADGVTKALAVRPLQLFNADAAISIQRQQLFNKLLRDGSTSLVNFGKNTQWAGRQLMVGFTVPLTIFGGVASKIFMDLEAQAISFRKVYGDIFTTEAEVEANLANIQELTKEFTKYGIAAKDTFELANIAAQAGQRGEQLTAATLQATRLGVLGQMEQAEAMRTTLTLQNAFQLSTEELAESINFLNIVENQSVLSLQDVAAAIPRVAPVINALGGSVQDLAVMLVAMREGGVTAGEGANALKTSLARLISPTTRASNMAKEFGINLDKIVKTNQGDILGAVMELAESMEKLDDLSQQRLLSEIFGKQQYARVAALFSNITNDASQAQRVLGLTSMTTEELADTAEKELGVVEDAISTKFLGAIERLKIEIAPLGQLFLEIATPLIEFATNLVSKFNELSPNVKKFAAIATVAFGVVTPVLIMLVGLIANFIGNMVKGMSVALNFINRARGAGSAVDYLSDEQIQATAAAASLEGRTETLTSALNIQQAAVLNLARAYQTYVGSASLAASGLPRGFRGPVRRMAKGGMVGGQGNGDNQPALLTPGEFVMNKDAVKQFGPILAAMNEGTVRKLQEGGPAVTSLYPDVMLRLQQGGENVSRRASLPGIEEILAPLAIRMGEARGIKPTQSQVGKGSFDTIAQELEGLAEEFVGRMEVHFNDTYSAIQDSDERLKRSWLDAGVEVEGAIDKFSTEAERTMARRFVGLEEDVFGTIATAPRREGDTKLSRQRRPVRKGSDVRSYMDVAGPTKSLFERRTGTSAAGLQMGHVMSPRAITAMQLSELAQDPQATSAVKAASQRVSEANTAGKMIGEAADTGARSAVGATSPAKDGVKLIDDYVDGMLLGAQKNAGQATQAGALLNNSLNMGAQGGPSSPYTVLGDDAMAKMRAAGEAANRGEGLLGPMPRGERSDIKTREIIPSDLGDELDDLDDKTKKAKKGLGGMSKAALGVGAALTVASGALAMMPGEIGSMAQSLFPLIIGLEGLLTLVPLLSGGGGFAGLAASLGAVGGAAASVALPIAAIAAAIAALVVGTIEAFKRSENLRNAFASIVDAGKELMSAVFGPVNGAMESFRSVGEKVANFLGNVFNKYVGMLAVWFNIVAKAIQIAVKIITMFVGLIKGAVLWVIENFPKMIGGILDKLGPVGETVKSVGKTIGDFFGSIPGFISNLFSSAIGFMDTLINKAIDGINFLIRAYNNLAGVLPGIQAIAEIDYVSLAETFQQAATPVPAPPPGAGVAYEENKLGLRPENRPTVSEDATDFEDLGDDTGAGSEKEKTFLENLIADLNANSLLYLNAEKGMAGYEKNRGKFFGIFQKLRRKGVSEDIIAALGTGPEAIKNARELLNMGKKELQKLMKDMETVSVGQVVENARRAAIADEQKLRAQKKIGGLSPEMQEIIMADETMIKAFATTKKGTPEYEKLIKVVQRLANAKRDLAEASKTEADRQQEAIDAIDEARAPVLAEFERREALFQQAFGNLERQWQPIIAANQKQIDLLEEQIDAVQDQIDAIQRLNDADERRIRGLERQKEMIQRQIEELDRQNELDKRRIDGLNREDEIRSRVAEGLERGLEAMDLQEDKIRDSYEKRFDALDKIAQVNDYIISQQNRQISLSQALAQGDIFAAAQAAQEMRAESAQYAQEQTRAGMEASMEAQVAGLRTEGGLTREQAEERIRQIQEQSYQTSLKIREIEDLIYQRNLEMIPLKDQQFTLDQQIQGIQDIIYGRETQILEIQVNRLQPLQDQLDAQQQSLANNQKALADAKASVRIEGQTYDELQNQISAEKEAYAVTVAQIKAGGDVRNSVENIRKKWVEVTNQIAAAVRTARQLREQAEMGARETFASIDLEAAEGRITADTAAQRKADAAARRDAALASIDEARDAEIAAALNSGTQALRMAKGGMVKGYRGGGVVSGIQARARGGFVLGDGARDSVPTMLTPGEFVVRKAMVKKYGKSMLSDINLGSFNVPTYNAERASSPVVINQAASMPVSMPVYNNYDMNFTINGTNADANDIAREVISRIGRIQDSRIRGNRV